MSYLKRQGGVTLVELVLVLAITAGAITSAIAIRSSLQKDISFSTSIEQVKNQILAAKNESVQTVKEGDNGAGNSNSFDFGRAVEFLPDDPGTAFEEHKNMRVSTIISELDDNNGSGLQQKMAQCDQRWVPYKDGVEFKGSEKRAIVFQRKPERIFVTPLNYNTAGGVVCSALAGQLTSTDTPDYGGYDSDNDGFPDTTDACPYQYAPNTPNGCPGGTPPPPPEGCDSNGYICGLYGRFYDQLPGSIAQVTSDSPALNANLKSAFNGEQIGETYSQTSSWLPILRYRTKNPAERVAVSWRGQIRIPANTTRNICLNTDDGSYMSINGVVVTNNYTDLDQQADRCESFTAGSNAAWYDILIAYNQRDTIESTPFASLTYTEGSNPEDFVPLTDLRSIPGQTIWPSTAFAPGLRGEYFSTSSNVNGTPSTFSGTPYSVWTDGVLLQPLADFTNTATFVARTGHGTDNFWNGFQASVRWTGQVNLTGGSPQICIQYPDNDGLTLKVGGVTQFFLNSPIWGSRCAQLTGLSGWQNISIEYTHRTQNGWEMGIRVTDGPFGSVPQFRRSLDASSNSSTMLPSDNDNTHLTFPAKNDCNNLNNTNVITRSFSNLSPGSTYKMDLSYTNYGASLPVGYTNYKFCVKVNGQFINDSNPIDFPAPTASGTRTHTLNNLSVDSSGSLNLELYWLNDTYTPPLDANFQLDRVDIYRAIDSTGNLVKTDQSKNEKNIVAKILSKISETGFAQAACGAAQTECSILIYDNYNPDSSGSYTFYPDEAELEFGIQGSSEKGVIKIDPQANSITREIDL